MSWLCNKCQSFNANIVETCCYCSLFVGVTSIRPSLETLGFDSIDVDIINVNIYRLKLTEYKFGYTTMPMTEQEQLFAKFFNAEITLVKDMDDLTLRQHREELSKIAFEARARLTAIGQETQERSAKSKKSKEFSTSVESDALTTDAINTIKNREKKLNKTEKLIEQLMKLPGITRAQAEAMVNIKTMPNVVKSETFKNEKLDFKAGEVKSFDTETKPTEILVTDITQTKIEVHKISESVETPAAPTKSLFGNLGKKS